MGDDLPHAVRFVCYHAGQFKAGRPVIHQHHRDVLPLKLSDQGRLGVSPRMTPSICLLWAVRCHSSAVEIIS